VPNASGILGKCSDVGVVRDLNEDYAAAVEMWPKAGGAAEPILLAAVADGMGGHAAGEVASRTAVDTLVETAQSLLASEDSSSFSLVSVIEKAFEEANSSVYMRGQAEAQKNGMGTTLTAAVISHDSLCIAHVGDSRAYLIRDGHARQLTRDHSIVQEKIDAGLISAEEAAQSEERNQLRRVVGTRPSVVSDVLCEDLRVGDVVLLGSDGLHSSLSDQELAGIIAGSPGPQAACENLVAVAKTRDGSDNITAVCVGIGAESFPQHASPNVSRSRSFAKVVLGMLLAIVAVLIAIVGSQLVRQIRPVAAPSSSGVSTTVPKPARGELGLPMQENAVRAGASDQRHQRRATARRQTTRRKVTPTTHSTPSAMRPDERAPTLPAEKSVGPATVRPAPQAGSSVTQGGTAKVKEIPSSTETTAQPTLDAKAAGDTTDGNTGKSE